MSILLLEIEASVMKASGNKESVIEKCGLTKGTSGLKKLEVLEEIV